MLMVCYVKNIYKQPSGHTSSRRIDASATSFRHHVPAGKTSRNHTSVVFLFLLFQDISAVTPEKLASGDLVEDDGKFFYSSLNVHRVIAEKGTVRQGPSKADATETPGRLTADRVYAFPCKTWPTQLLGWKERQKLYDWPAEEIKCVATLKGCFLVPVGHKLSYNSDIEWRLSPSLAERILMFSLNETQMKCYVLLKHVSKCFITPIIGKTLTSFQCKMAVLTCAELTPLDIWRPDRLLECMDICLGQLILWCGIGWCPQYILPQENVFAGRLNRNKLDVLGDTLLAVYNSRWLILRTRYDWGFGEALHHAITGQVKVLPSKAAYFPYQSSHWLEYSSNDMIFQDISETTEMATVIFIKYQWAIEINTNILQMLLDADSSNVKTCLTNILSVQQKLGTDFDRYDVAIIKGTIMDIVPVMRLYTGCIVSSMPGQLSNKDWWSSVYSEWILPGFKENALHPSLKLATVLLHRGEKSMAILAKAYGLLNYLDVEPHEVTDVRWLDQLMQCQAEIDDMKDQDDFAIAECILKYAESEYLHATISACPCRLFDSFKNRVNLLQEGIQESDLRIVSCVFFMRGEMNSVPYPLKFEYYRSTTAEVQDRNPYKDQWMDMLVIDPAPYLYFLQYECYRHQKKQNERKEALSKFIDCFREEENLFHKETALNLLGYCMLLEDRLGDAFQCYSQSLQIQPTNNCARWHLALMANKLIREDH